MSPEQLAPLLELRVFLVTLAVLAIPGWALLSLRAGWRDHAPLQAWALALSLGVAFYPVLFAVLGAVAPWVPLGRTALLAILAFLLLVALWRLRRDCFATVRFTRLEQIALAVIAVTLATRAWVAHLEPFPAWSDSLHHVLLTELTANAGRLPASMEPYFPIPLGRYHLGFYALTATVQALAAVPAHVAVTWVAQVLSGLCGLGVYLVLDRHVGRVAAVIGVVCAGLISHQPAFYVNWGRFTQLAAQTILLPAWLVTWEALRRLAASGTAPADRAERRERVLAVAAASLLVAGVLLLHLRVAIFLLVLLGATLAAELWRARRAPRARRLLLATSGVLLLGSLALTGPRLLRAVSEYGAGHWAVFRFQGGLAASAGQRLLGDPEYFSFSRQSLGYLFADGPVLAAVLALAAIALLRRNRLAWLFTLWTTVLLALGEAHRLEIPLLNVTNLGAVLILLYLPASLLVATGVAELLVWLRAGAGAQTAVLIGFLALGAIGARDRVAQLEPARFFVTAADLRAMRWLDEVAPDDAIVAVRTVFWLPRAPHGSDAGYWIPYLTKHRTTVGPMISNLAPQYANWMIEMSRHVAAVREDDAELVWLWRRGVRYLYLGARGDPGEAADLAASPHLALRYADGGVFIFEVDPSGASDQRPDG